MRNPVLAFLLTGLVCGLAPESQAQDLTAAQRRMSANEFSAVVSLQKINVACVTYSVTYGIGYPSALSYLRFSGPPSRTAASLIDEALAAGVKDGYSFTYTSGPVTGGIVPTYTVRADPVTPGQTGQRHYFTDQSGVIRWNASESATAADPPIDRASEYKPRPPSEPTARGEVEINDEKAADSLRVINTACITYANTYGAGFPAELSELGPLRTANAHAANLIDETLASGTKDGYAFVYTPGKPIRGVVPSYTITADPVTPGLTGHWHFFTDQSGAVRANATATASASDPIVPRHGEVSFGTTGAAPERGGDASQGGSGAKKRIKVDLGVTEGKLIQRVAPFYPPLARQARIQGTVKLHAIIGTDGSIISLEVVSGHPLLIQSALDAVKQWKYKPTRLLGQPVKVETFIEVNYTLGDAPKPGAPSDTNPKPQ